MADLKISQLTNATTPLTGSETIPIVQGGVNKKLLSSFLSPTYLTPSSLSSSGNISNTSAFIFASGTITLTLPTAVGISGKIFYIKNIGSGIITINATGAETIDGLTDTNIEFTNSVIGLISDGANWYIF